MVTTLSQGRVTSYGWRSPSGAPARSIFPGPSSLVWTSVSAPGPARPAFSSRGARGGGTHPSCPKVMFSLNRRLSSRSSWVMWHHLSLQAQEGQQGASGPRPRRSTLPCSDLQVLASLTQRGLLGRRAVGAASKKPTQRRGSETHTLITLSWQI